MVMNMKLDAPEASTATTWWVEIFLDESDGESRASARLHSHTSRTPLTGLGVARVSPQDPDVPEVGYEVATARALHQLADLLLEGAASDISDLTHEDVTSEDLGLDNPPD
jgi:Rv2632c-like